MKYHHQLASRVYTALSRLRSYTTGHHMAFVSQEFLAETAGLDRREVRYGIDTINTSPKYGFYITWNKREGHIFVKHDADIERELKVIARDFERLNNRRKKLLYIQRRNGNQTMPFGEEENDEHDTKVY